MKKLSQVKHHLPIRPKRPDSSPALCQRHFLRLTHFKNEEYCVKKCVKISSGTSVLSRGEKNVLEQKMWRQGSFISFHRNSHRAPRPSSSKEED